jgi:thiamine-phosphate pyrophosphorylase
VNTGPLPRLCAIVDEEVAARMRRDVVDLARALLRGGVRWLQLRAKRASGAEFHAWAEALQTLARDRNALLVVNDRADIARVVGAGVHVGQDDLPPRHARAIVGEGAVVGFSTHTLQQIDAVLGEPVTYLAVGPVFGTTTKETGYAPVGLDLVRAAAARAAGRVPIVAIGGITLERAPAVLNAGAAAVAVISDLLTDPDPEARARLWTACVDAVRDDAAGGLA